MVNNSPGLDAVFSALADPTRRRIVERLARGELTVGELSAGFPISAPAISKHVRILEESGLLERRVDGRIHRCRLAPKPMRDAADWVETQERFWSGAFDRLDAYLTRTQPKKGTR
jgi:DNA-binding transcriptional ArsR family regulator